MWNYIIAILMGAAIPLITIWLQSREKRKYFELERKEKLKMVAIENRLKAHQQALKYWDDLRSVIHSPDSDKRKREILKASRDFWYLNCLYLEKQTRFNFRKAFWIVSNYKIWLDLSREMTPGKERDEHKKFYMDCWDDFHKLFEIIQKEVELEPIKAEKDTTPEGESIKKEI